MQESLVCNVDGLRSFFNVRHPVTIDKCSFSVRRMWILCVFFCRSFLTVDIGLLTLEWIGLIKTVRFSFACAFHESLFACRRILYSIPFPSLTPLKISHSLFNSAFLTQCLIRVQHSEKH